MIFINMEKWYRGHSRQQHALDNFGIIWLTDDPYYAEVYAEDDGVVSVVYIDDSKINAAPAWEDIDFDYYVPDDESIDEFKQEGYNCYYFTASYDGEDFQCLALFDKSPVVKIEEYKEGIKENVMKLTKKDLNYIISEATQRIIVNEISWATAHDANEKSEDRVDLLDSAWDKFTDACDNLVRALEGMDDRTYGQDDIQPLNSQGSILASKLASLQNKIYQYIERKRTQQYNLNDFEGEKWREAFGNKDFDQVADDIEQKSVEHDEKGYDENGRFIPWRDYRKTVLSKDEQDFNDRNP